jgi:hypothetical protein
MSVNAMLRQQPDAASSGEKNRLRRTRMIGAGNLWAKIIPSDRHRVTVRHSRNQLAKKVRKIRAFTFESHHQIETLATRSESFYVEIGWIVAGCPEQFHILVTTVLNELRSRDLVAVCAGDRALRTDITKDVNNVVPLVPDAPATLEWSEIFLSSLSGSTACIRQNLL